MNKRHRAAGRPVQPTDTPPNLCNDMRPLGRIVIDVPGLRLDWTLVPDRRDVRRWRAVDLAGVEHAHAAWPTILRMLAAGQPQALGRRRW